MYGAIIGDVSGSYLEILEITELRNKSQRSYEERIKILDKEVPLFDNNCSCTDDSILTVAIADAIINNRDYEEVLREYGERELNDWEIKGGRSRFGHGFVEWLKHEKEGYSLGNGCAMRISPVGYLFNSEEEVLEEARKATIPSHNHPESIKGAQEVAMTIFLARNGYSKEQIKKYLENKFEMNFNYDIEELRHNYKFSGTIMKTTPMALFCFFESNSFEDAIRKTLSIGGDTDTLACIVGSISEAYYGIDLELINEVQKYIPEYFKSIINQFYNKKGLVYEKNK